MKADTRVIIYKETYYRQAHVYLGRWCLSATSVWAHKKAQSLSNMDGFLLLRKMSSFFPSSVRPNEQKIQFKLLKEIQLHDIIKVFRVLWYTLRMLQPVAVRVVQVTTLKLLLAVVRNWHRDERVHVVKALLIREAQVNQSFLFFKSLWEKPAVRSSFEVWSHGAEMEKICRAVDLFIGSFELNIAP